MPGCPSTPGEVETRCTTTVLTAHRTERRRLHYRWHAFSGREVIIHCARSYGGAVVFHCQTDDDDKADRRQVPAWMFDRAVCQQMQMMEEPSVSLPALVELRWLLEVSDPRPRDEDRLDPEQGGADDEETPPVGGGVGPTEPFSKAGARAELGVACGRRTNSCDESTGSDDPRTVGAREPRAAGGGT